MSDSARAVGSADDASGDRPLEVLHARARAWAALCGEAEGGVRLGRYRLLEEIGSGAMGLVYAAYDPRLDRRVAIKVLRARTVSPADTARLQREARALARLTHPNVVAVHDVGLVEPEGQEGGRGAAMLFLVMEHVRGTTLRRWLAEPTRTTAQVLEVLDQAGRGLAAAHRVGLVHRDFKPDNVMIGEDERARVMDFGLARLLDDVPSTITSAQHRPVELDGDRYTTRDGAIVGTPAYMAPEQLQHGSVDARADQFAFCVTAWEALTGKRPALGLESMRSGERRSTHVDSSAPSWMLAVLERGLEVEPEARYPDMDQLLAALRDDPSRRRRRRLAAVAGVAVLGLAAGGTAWHRAQRESSCRDDAASIDAVWNDDAREAVGSALLATALPYADDTRQRVEAGLDEYAAQWQAARESSCLAELDGVGVSASMVARTDACLEDTREALRSWIELVPTATAGEVAELAEMTAELPPVGNCLDAAWLTRQTEPTDEAARERTQQARRGLARARSLTWLGRADEARSQAEAIEARALEDGLPRLSAEAAYQVAAAAAKAGDPEAAQQARERALERALEAGDDALTVQVLTDLAYVDGKSEHVERAKAWLTAAQAMLPRVEAEPGYLAARLHNAAGVVAYGASDYPRAEEEHREALALAQRVLPPAHVQITRSLNNLAAVQTRQGRHEQAIETLQQVVDIRTRVLGPNSPSVASALNNLGAAYGSLGRFAEAETVLVRSLAITEAALGPEHEQLGNLLMTLGVDRVYLRHTQQGIADLERAIAVLEKAYGPDHPRLARPRSALGMAWLEAGRPETAVPLLESSIAALVQAHGEQHHDVAVALGTLGSTQLTLGRLDEAESTLRRVLEIREAVLPPGHVDTASARLELGRVLAERGQLDAAVTELQLSLAVYEGEHGNERNAAVARVSLGDVALAQGRLDDALAQFRAVADAGDALDRDELRTWGWQGIGAVHEQRGEWTQAEAAFERALRSGTTAFEPDSPSLATARLGLALAAHARANHEAALVHAERGLALTPPHAAAPWWRAEAELVLATVLAADPAQAARAREGWQRACAAPRSALAMRLRACERDPDGPARGGPEVP